MKEHDNLWRMIAVRTILIFRSIVALLLFQSAAPDICPQGKSHAESAFIYHQRLIFVEMSVNNHRGLLFLFDTGASASAIDLKTAERLKLPFAGVGKVEGTAGVISVRRALVKSLSVGRARAENLTVPAYDLGGVLSPHGRQVAGILGYDFLRFFSVQIDFLNRTLRFYPQGVAGPAGAASGVTIPIILDNGIPRLRGILNGDVDADFRLDTGASLFETPDVYLNVTEDVWKRLTHSDTELKPERYFAGGGVGGAVRLPVARIKRFSVNRVTVPSPFVIVQPKVGYFARPAAVGFISNNFLEKFSPVIIDYLESRLYLTK
ncbi:MAG: retropepsin-like aspartic protease [Pyrinomonadaceae bacterium]